MGEVVPIGASPEKPNATVGQALFSAVMDELTAQGVEAIPRTLVATSVRHGTAALNDGVQPEIVLAGCLTALAQGKPQFTAHIIGDICFAKAGMAMTPAEYRQLLALENRRNNEAVNSVRTAVAQQQQKALGEGSDD